MTTFRPLLATALSVVALSLPLPARPLPPRCPVQGHSATPVSRTQHNYAGTTECDDAGDPCLNVYEPQTRAEGLPTVLWIHGGGWSIPESNKDSAFNDQMCTALASNGVLVVSCNYYLSTFDPCGGSTTGADYKRTITNVKQAIGWIRGEGDVLFAFPEDLVVAGSSAGGHLAAMMATTMGPTEKLYDPDPAHGDYSVDFAILYSPPLDFVRMGCQGIEYPASCLSACVQQPAQFPCGVPTCGATRVGPIPAGYPCADPVQEICDDTTYQEALLGQRWNPASPPLSLKLGAGGSIQLFDCSSYPQMPSMPSRNRWYDASPFFWVSGDEPPMQIVQLRCDAYVSAQEGLDFAQRVNWMNGTVMEPAPCQVQTLEPPGCLSCRHAAEAFSETGVAANILQLIEARFP